VSRFLVVIALGACGSHDGDIVGPFTGATHHFAIDRIDMPATSEATTTFGDDLDGDGTADNQLGVIFAALSMTHDATTHGTDMIDAGVIASTLTIQADSLDAGIAGVTYYGRSGAVATVMGGTFTAGAFASNRSATTHAAGAATIVLPVFADADPLELPLTDMEIDLAPDGAGGYDGKVRGGIPIADAYAEADTGIAQMMIDNPTSHLVFARVIDTNHDGMVTPDEVGQSSLLAAFLVADLANKTLVSVGYAIHLIPCDSSCAPPPALDTCHDRALDGNETDVDCGGSCSRCATAAACVIPADCQSNACDGGHCRAPTCSDGVRDGFESDVDCGANCPKCSVGQTCANPDDCASGNCSGAVASAGTCSL
jgi:hypothetical protein